MYRKLHEMKNKAQQKNIDNAKVESSAPTVDLTDDPRNEIGQPLFVKVGSNLSICP